MSSLAKFQVNINITQKKLIAIAIIGFMFSISTAGAIIVSATGTPVIMKTVIEPGSMTDQASYIIFKDATGATCAKNGTSGEIVARSINSSSVFQSIINALSIIGGTIQIKSGNYVVSNTILLFGNIRIEGEMRSEQNHISGTVLTNNQVNGHSTFASGDLNNYLGGGIGSLTIIGNPLSGSGVNISLPVNYVLKDITISSCGGDGIRINGAVDVLFDHVNVMQNKGWGIDFKLSSWGHAGAYVADINSCLFQNNTLGNIRINEGTYTVQSCSFENAGSVGKDHILVSSETLQSDVKISGCNFAGTGNSPETNDAITVKNCTEISIIGNSFNTHRNGINITSSSGRAIITGNDFEYTEGWAIKNAAKDTIISGNNIKGIYGRGGGVNNTGDRTNIINNIIEQSDGAYSSIVNSGSYVTMQNNILYHSSGDAIQNSGYDCIISGNHIAFALHYAIANYGDTALISSNWIIGANYANATYDCIYNGNGAADSTLIDGNIILGNNMARYGVHIVDGNPTVSNNVFNTCVSGNVLGGGNNTRNNTYP